VVSSADAMTIRMAFMVASLFEVRPSN